MFRDENDNVIRKAKADTKLQVKAKIPRSAGKGKQPRTEAEVTTSPSSAREYTKAVIAFERKTNADWRGLFAHNFRLLLQLSPTAFEDQGAAFFFTHYAAVISPTTGLFWPHITTTNKPFFHAVSSVWLAGLSNVTQDHSLMVPARHKYVATLVSPDPSHQTSNSTDIPFD